MTHDQMIPIFNHAAEDYFNDDSTERWFTLCWLNRHLTVRWSGPLRRSARTRQAEFRAVWNKMTKEDPF